MFIDMRCVRHLISRCEGEHSWRCLEESRAGRESNTMNMARGLDWPTREGWGESKREREQRGMEGERRDQEPSTEDQESKRQPRKLMVDMTGLCRNEKLGEERAMGWRSLGEEVG